MKWDLGKDTKEVKIDTNYQLSSVKLYFQKVFLKNGLCIVLKSNLCLIPLIYQTYLEKNLYTKTLVETLFFILTVVICLQ